MPSGRLNGTLRAGAHGYTDNTDVPPWQSAEWSDLGMAPAAYRYIPDVSTTAQNALIVVQGRWTPSGGTSLASPVWALAQEWHRAMTGSPIGPASAVSYLYALGQDGSLSRPAYIT